MAYQFACCTFAVLVRTLRPVAAAQKNQGMEDPGVKMRRLALAKKRNPGLTTALVFGTPAEEDITFSDKQRDRLRSNVLEIHQQPQIVRSISAKCTRFLRQQTQFLQWRKAAI
jgi:hypothetical protein